MATAMSLHISGLRTPAARPLNTSRSLSLVPPAAIPISNSQTRERQKMKDLFREARERCIADPMDGVSFTVDEFHRALDDCGFGSEVGSKVKGTVLMITSDGAFVDILSTTSAFLPVEEACIHKIRHVSEAGIFPGLQEEFAVIGQNYGDDSLVLSLRPIQYNFAWERCQQLLAIDVVVKGKIVGGNKGGLVVLVEGLNGFVPFSQVPEESSVEALLGKELPLKFLTVDKKQSQLVLSNSKAMVDSPTKIEIGSVVLGTVRNLKPYGALIDVGGVTGLLHVSQISHDRISDIAAVLQPGDSLKVLVLSHDHEIERLSLSTKKLEPTPGDMVRNPKLVFEKADEMAENFRQKLAHLEEIACAEILKSQSEIRIQP